MSWLETSAGQRKRRAIVGEGMVTPRNHLVDFDGPGFLEYDRIRVAEPLVMAARWALVLGSRLVKRRSYAVEVVFTAVFGHDGSLPPTGGAEA